jgi:stage III sporulation protein AH
MKQILKKNQIIISVIAIMLIAAGYMNYTSNEKQALETAVLTDSEKYAGIGDATLVSANVADNSDVVNNNEGQNITDDSVKKEEIKSNEQNTETTENAVQNEINTSTTVTETSGDQYFAELRLERDKMYSQMLESYQKILSNSQISETQKEISENEIKKINDTRNAIMIAENLIKNKGFQDLIIFINGDSISIIVKAKELKEEQIAQIQNIISRELKGEIENIHISNKE